jgi:hypothetical protein
MGYDISYHPIKESELHDWYFSLDFTKLVEDDFSEVDSLITQYSLTQADAEQYRQVLKLAVNIEPGEKFENSHGYFAAVVQGFFKPYYYTRGSAFSFLILEKPHFKSYTKPWQEFLSYRYENPIYNILQLNYSSGVFIPANKVKQLLEDYATLPHIKAELDAFYDEGRIDVFLKALRYAADQGDGLLEATEVIEPNPLSLNDTKCYSNLLNCDIEGALLYQEKAKQQIAEIEKREGLPDGEITANATYEKVQIAEPKPAQTEKKGFFKRLFG